MSEEEREFLRPEPNLATGLFDSKSLVWGLAATHCGESEPIVR